MITFGGGGGVLIYHKEIPTTAVNERIESVEHNI